MRLTCPARGGVFLLPKRKSGLVLRVNAKPIDGKPDQPEASNSSRRLVHQLELIEFAEKNRFVIELCEPHDEGFPMNKPLFRAYLVELLGTFALVFVAAGVILINQLTVPEPEIQHTGQTELFNHQPGLFGIALAQGLIFATMLAVTMHVSGGFLNPAVTVMLWVFNRMESKRAAWLIGAQLLGAVLAATALRFTFSDSILQQSRMGAPHLNSLVYEQLQAWRTLISGALIELILTFFLVFAIFGAIRRKGQWLHEVSASAASESEETKQYRRIDERLAALLAGLTLTACVLVGYPITGAALNPARWFGPAFWEWAGDLGNQGGSGQAFADMFVYLAGPVIGALLAGLVYFKLLSPDEERKTKSRK